MRDAPVQPDNDDPAGDGRRHRSDAWERRLARAQRIAVSVLAVTLGVIGLALLVLPGPGIAVLLVALGLLASEYAWARRWLTRLRRAAGEARGRLGPGHAGGAAEAKTGATGDLQGDPSAGESAGPSSVGPREALSEVKGAGESGDGSARQPK